MIFDLAFLVVSLLIMGASYYYLFGRKKKVTPQPQEPPQQQQQQPVQRAQQLQVRREVQVDSSDEEPADGTLEQNAQKQAQKEAKKQQRQQQQEYIRQQADLRDKKEVGRRRAQEEKDRLREEEEQKAEEWKLKIAEDQAKKEQEDYDQWRNMFAVEEQGNEKLGEEEEVARLRELLDRFCNYIKLRKVVQLEDLSSEFGMSTKEVIERIRSLELNKQLNGLIDERGKYIYLTEQELLSVKNLIEARGKITRSELMSECNRLIKLDPSQKDQQTIMQEEQQLLLEVQTEFV